MCLLPVTEQAKLVPVKIFFDLNVWRLSFLRKFVLGNLLPLGARLDESTGGK